jgi:nucleoside-diphosphate-sugar epimerase
MSRAFLSVLNAPRELIHNEAFNVGQTEENYRVKDMAQIVIETVPGSKLEFAPDASPDKRNYRVSCEKIASILTEFKPQWTVQKGAQELYDAYRKVGLKIEEFEGTRYRRIHHIKHLISIGRLGEDLRWRSVP